MATNFLKKHHLSSSINSRVQDFELVHPINKSIKPTQIYFDTESTPRSTQSQYRTVSLDSRASCSIILKPIPRPPRHQSDTPREAPAIPYKNIQLSPISIPNQALPIQKPQVKKEKFKEFQIRSPRFSYNPYN